MARIDIIISQISEIPGLSCNGPSADVSVSIPTVDAWRQISSVDSEPCASVDVDSERADLVEWFVQTLESEKIGGHVYLSVGGYGGLPWVQVELSENNSALADLWLSTEAREILLLTDSRDCLIGVTEEEHDFEIHKVWICSSS